MIATYKSKLEILRQRVPIGINAGLTLLEDTQGNVDEAIALFINNLINIVKEKINISQEEARRHLIKTNYDIGKTIISIENERYSLTERIVKRYKNDHEEALDKISLAIEDRENIKRNFWLDVNSFDKLSSYQYCLVMVMEWIRFEGWEGFETALDFHLDQVCEQIDKTLLFLPMSSHLQKAYVRKNEIYKKNQEIMDAISIHNQLIINDPVFKECESYYLENKNILIDKLYLLVINNINQFP